MFDTILILDHTVNSAHADGVLFVDEEIVEKLGIIKKVEIENEFEVNEESKVYATFTKHNKAIIHQQARRGCTAATAAMLIFDNGKKPDLQKLRSTNLGNDESQISDIEDVGLTALESDCKDLKQLREAIMNKGSCIATTRNALGGHVVVDHVSEDLSKIRLRDPYHGWEISVTQEAFLKEWSGGIIIQVENCLNND